MITELNKGINVGFSKLAFGLLVVIYSIIVLVGIVVWIFMRLKEKTIGRNSIKK